MLSGKLVSVYRNVQLNWNRLGGTDTNDRPLRITWADLLPQALTAAVGKKRAEDVTYAGAHVYASVDPVGDAPLRRFLHAMDSFPGYTVLAKEGRSSKHVVRCARCRNEIDTCPECHEPLRRTVEKGIDTAIVTDMIQMAYDNVYDIAILGSTDADLCPAVTFSFQRIGKPVYNVWLRGAGHS